MGISKKWIKRIVLPLIFLTLFLLLILNYDFISVAFAKNFNQIWNWLGTTEYRFLDYPQKQNLTYQDLTEVVGTIDFIGQDFINVPARGKAVLADLQKMTITLYQDDQVIKSFTIVSIGKPGLPWETPRGQFSILNKEENHRSSITQVWMPYSLQFLGNYFIHGWPYYDSGTLVSLGYSGGCIRLGTADAREVFSFVDRGTVLIIGGNNLPNNSVGRYLAKDRNLFPAVTAESYLVADLDNGAEIIRKNSRQLYPIASLTKLMTALVFLDQVNPINQIVVGADRQAIPYRDVGKLETGEVFIAKDLLWPLILESSNKAAEVLATSLGDKRFVTEMNNRARTIGLANLTFADPAGIDSGNISSAEDLFVLAKHIFFNKSYIFSVSRLAKFELANHVWQNVNPFVHNENFLGGKTGQTELAKQTALNLFTVPFGEEKRRVAIIVLRSTDRDGDTQKLLDYLGDNVSFIKDETQP